MATVLAVETSCDETAIAIVKNRNILSNVIASQIKLHEEYGGVVPELASRQHLEMVNPCIDKALEDSGLSWWQRVDIFRLVQHLSLPFPRCVTLRRPFEQDN